MKIDYGVFGDALAAASIGTWRIEVDEGKEPRMYADATMLKLLGVAEDAELSPEEVYHAWYDHVDPAHYDAVAEGVGHMLNGETAEIQYPWHHPDGRTIVVRCGGIRDESYTAGQRVAGIHQWVTTMHHVDREDEANQHALKDALDRAEASNRHNETLHQIIKSGPWAFSFNERNEVTKALISPECNAVVRNDVGDGNEWMALVHPDDYDRVKKAFNDALCDPTGKTVYDIEYRIRANTGEFVWIHSAGRVIRSADGGGEFYGICVDITDTVEKARGQKERLEEYKTRMDILKGALNAVQWSYFFDTDRNVTGVRYADNLPGLIDNNLAEDAWAWVELTHPDDRQADLAAFKAAIADRSGKTPYDIITRLRRRNGSYGWFRSVGRVILNEDGGGELVGLLLDITESVEQEQKLRVQQEREARAIAAKDQMMADVTKALYGYNLMIDLETLKYTVNIGIGMDSASEVFGSTDDFAVAYKKKLALIAPKDRDRLSRLLSPESLRKYAANGVRGAVGETLIYEAIVNGESQWHETNLFICEDENGNPNANILGRNVTQRVVQERKRLLGAVPVSLDVLDKANIGLWAFELDEGQPPRMYHDKTMLGLVGLDHQLPPEEAYHAWYDHVDKDSYQLVNDAVAKMMAGEHAEVQYPWHHPDGHTIIVRCGGVRNFSYTNGIRVEGTHQNVSEMLRYDEAEEKRRHELAVAQAASKAKTEFLFNMSHDIRTPMNAIMGFSDIAKRSLGDPETLKDCFAKIDSSGELLLSLINSILDMSRIESGKAKAEEIEADVYESFRGVETTMKALAVAKSIRLDFEYGSITDRHVYADCDRAMRVFVNLISNAIKYTNSGGIVKVKVEQIGKAEGGKAVYRYTFADNGIGMSEEYQKHLYENFSREQNSTTSGIQGTGLGLALCKSLIELMGGTIACRSKQGEGTTFTVELPFRVRKTVAGESEQVDGRARIPAAPGLDGGPGVSALPSFSGKRVLLVEDNELNREVATYVLKEQGFEVESAEDGSIAVRMVREKGLEYYDYILMDIQMPIMGGYEATKAIRSYGFNRPIIALSANAFAEDRATSIAAGMDAHVAKPIKVKELMTVLAKFGK